MMTPPVRALGLSLCLVAAACSGEEKKQPGGEAGAGPCVAPEPPAAALLKMGVHDGVRILPDGRALTPAGQELEVGGFPVDVRVHPTLPLAYVANAGYGRRSVQVVDLVQGRLTQDIERSEAFHGIALAPDAARLYLSGGDSGQLEVYGVAADGALTAEAQLDATEGCSGDCYPSGIAVSPDGARVWVAQYLGEGLLEVDAATLAVTRRVDLGVRGYAVLHVPARDELWVSGFGERAIAVVDATSFALKGTVDAGANPLGLAATADGARVFAAVTDGDIVVAIDPATRTIVDTQAVGDPALAAEDGTPLPASSPSGLFLDEAAGRLYVVRAADNAVSVLSPATLDPAGAIPVGWYPTAAAVAGERLVVTNGKGVGVGPLPAYGYGDESGKAAMTGTVSIVPLAGLDLAVQAQKVEENVRRPSTVYPFECEGSFPIPTRAGGPTPIEHIVLIVRENKTYDSLFGDMAGTDADPSKVMYGDDITPNLHALARKFAHSENFYNDSESSVQGHLWLTSSFVNDYVERTWLEDYRGNPGYAEDAPLDRGQPEFGTFFTHLMKHGVDYTVFGEVVGSFGQYEGQSVMAHVDTGFPGLFYNTGIKDALKAERVVEKLVTDEEFPPFVFVLLPNDHTNGTGADQLTPEAMINDNDVATGIIVDGLSKSKFWEKTAVFIVQDDTQVGADHVDYHRSVCVIASPWVKPGYVSRVHTSFPSLFRTFELILGVPPMNRYDANGTPFYDMFRSTPEPDTEFDALPRTVPDETNGAAAAGQAWSEQMDFSGPDRNPDLGDLLWWSRMGAPPPGSHVARQLALGLPPAVSVEEDDEDDARERDVHDSHIRAVERWLAAHPEVRTSYVRAARQP